jgi:O-antigen/teichoic acid export membrane protein
MTTAVSSTAAPPEVDAATPSGRRLTVNYLLLTGGESLAKLCSLVAYVYLGRILGPERYGSLEFVLAMMIFFTLPVDFGLGVYGTRELARNRRRAAELLREVSALRLVLACISFVVLLVVVALLPRDGEVKLLLVMCGLSLFVEPVLVEWFFQAHDCMHWVALTMLTRRGAFAALVLLFIRRDTPLPWVGVCECGAAIMVAVVCMAILRRRLGFGVPRPWQRPAVLLPHLRQSAPIGLSHLAWALQWYFATVLMGWLAADREELGWFGASHRAVMALHTFVYLYFYNLLPSLSRGASWPREHLRELLSRSLAMTIWAGILVALALTLVGGDLLSLLYGPQFQGVYRPLAVLGWLIPVALVSGHYRYVLIACNFQHVDLCCTAVAAGSAVVLGTVLIPLYGAVGAACALLAANVVSLCLAYACVNRFVVPIPCHGPLALPLAAVAAAAACAAVVARQGVWPAAVAAGLAYLSLFSVWAGWHVFRTGLAVASVALPVAGRAEEDLSPG